MPTTYLNVEQVCEVLDISLHTWNKWRRRRVGPPMRRLPNGSLRISAGALDDWLEEQAAA